MIDQSNMTLPTDVKIVMIQLEELLLEIRLVSSCLETNYPYNGFMTTQMHRI